MKEEIEKEEQKAEQEQPESAETVEEAEPEEEVEEIVEEAVEAEEEVPITIEEEAKPPPREEKIEEEEIVEERIYTIPLGKAWIAPPNKRTPRAIRMIKSFVKRHMKLEARGRGAEGEMEEEASKKLIMSNEVNERVWSRGIQKPPRKIRVRAAKDKEGNITVYLAEGD